MQQSVEASQSALFFVEQLHADVVGQVGVGVDDESFSFLHDIIITANKIKTAANAPVTDKSFFMFLDLSKPKLYK